ncbi:MAG: hypothetical protein Q6373_007730 [Candidatus Sigynarchaeota archaeon]
MASKKWKLSFGDVELKDTALNVSGNTNMKGVEKSYKDIVATLDKKSNNAFKEALEKSKGRDVSIDPSTHQVLQVFFSKVADVEGVKAVEGTAAAAVSARRDEYESASTRTRERRGEEGKSKYKVSIVEALDFQTEYDGKITGSSVSGTVSVVNGGSKNRIWDIDLTFEGGEKADLPKEVHIPELDPGEEWKQEYKIKIGKDDTPLLKIVEEIDTFPETAQKSQVFVYDKDSRGQVAQIVITAENTGEAKLSEIEIRKAIPPDFNDVDVVKTSDGRAKRDGDEVVWKIEELDGGKKASMELKIKVRTNEKKAFKSGEIKAKYFVAAGTYSGLKTTFVDGWSDQIHFVDRDERDEEPDVWDCTFEFRNRSEFPMKLERYNFVFGDENTETKVIDEILTDVIIPPGETWKAKPWDLKSEDEPTFSENIVYSVIADTEYKLSMSQTIAPIELRILALEGKKTFSKSRIASYRESTIDALVEVKTQGKAPIDKIHIEDRIPANFKNPLKENMKIMIEDKEIPADDFEFKFEPAGDDLSVERKMLIDIKDVLENIGELDDETEIKITYPLVAYKPPRDTQYTAPILFQGFVKPSGVIEWSFTPDPITVAHERRRTHVGKAIAPGKSKGDYDIVLIYKNKGDSPKTDVKIADFVPKGFSVTSASKVKDIEPEQAGQKDGTMLTWTFKEVAANEEIEIKYSIHGEGDEYSLKDIEAKAFK